MPAMDWTPLKAVIDANESFLISSHVRPDADALGSELGMRAILLAMGKKVSIVQSQKHNEFAQGKIDVTVNELKEERDCVKDLLT